MVKRDLGKWHNKYITLKNKMDSEVKKAYKAGKEAGGAEMVNRMLDDAESDENIREFLCRYLPDRYKEPK